MRGNPFAAWIGLWALAAVLSYPSDSYAIDPENWEPTVSLVGKTSWLHLTHSDMEERGLKDGLSLQFQFSYN